MFPPSVPRPPLKGTAVPGLWQDDAQQGACRAVSSRRMVPEKHLLSEHFPSLLAEEFLPSASPDQLCENDGL